jgi:hypothetical protein
MDDIWVTAVEAEAQLVVPETQGLDMDVRYLVKPVGSPYSAVMVLSSYPTKDPRSTVHVEYGTVDDLWKISMFLLYAKLGLHKANSRSTGVFHLDIFPRRLDRKQMLYADDVLATIPKVLWQYWANYADQLLAASSARIIIVAGHSACKHYQGNLTENNVEHQVFWIPGFRRHIFEIPAARIERNEEAKSLASRWEHLRQKVTYVDWLFIQTQLRNMLHSESAWLTLPLP